ncbi:MAG: hypothetical protein H0U44_00770 [Flavisolibacter sp.]|jgi:hypothetical protein|nr:hypothetical protein [Flavisolibacter sp.]
MLWQLFRRDSLRSVFEGHFVDAKTLYAYKFNVLCNVSFIGELDTSMAYAFIMEQFGSEIRDVYQHCYFEQSDHALYFNNTLILLQDKRLIELGNNYCQVLHRPRQNVWAHALLKNLSVYKLVQPAPSIGFSWQVSAQ